MGAFLSFHAARVTVGFVGTRTRFAIFTHSADKCPYGPVGPEKIMLLSGLV